jgi:hypothetical protein
MDKKSKWVLVGIIILFFLIQQYMIFIVGRDYWFDEAFTAQTVYKLDMNGFNSINWGSYDVHPSMAYLPFAVWMKIPHGKILEHCWLAELDCLAMMLFLLFVGIGLNRVFGFYGVLSVILFAISTTYIHYGNETRQYAFLWVYSAIIFVAVVDGFENWKWYVAALFAVALLPWTHYLASMAVFFYTVMVLAILKIRGKISKNVLVKVVAFLSTGVIAILTVLPIALAQKSRVFGTWFAPAGISDWPGAVAYTFFFSEHYKSPNIWQFVYFALMYVLIMCAIIFFFIWAVKRIVQKGLLNDQQVIMLFMGLTVVIPLVSLILMPFMGGHGFGNLYHPRFFMVLDWMFAAMIFVAITKWCFEKRKRIVIFGTIIVLMVIMIFIYVNYMVNHDLIGVEKQTPCSSMNDAPLYIGHDGPFSSLSFIVYGREHACNWVNFVSTFWTKEVLNGGGIDAQPDGTTYYNLTIPPNLTTYDLVTATDVDVDGNRLSWVPIFSRKNITVIASGDGIQVWRVNEVNYSIIPKEQMLFNLSFNVCQGCTTIACCQENVVNGMVKNHGGS